MESAAALFASIPFQVKVRVLLPSWPRQECPRGDPRALSHAPLSSTPAARPTVRVYAHAAEANRQPASAQQPHRLQGPQRHAAEARRGQPHSPPPQPVARGGAAGGGRGTGAGGHSGQHRAGTAAAPVGSNLLAHVRGAPDLATWYQLVLGCLTMRGAFPIDALFRAAHFADEVAGEARQQRGRARPRGRGSSNAANNGSGSGSGAAGAAAGSPGAGSGDTSGAGGEGAADSASSAPAAPSREELVAVVKQLLQQAAASTPAAQPAAPASAIRVDAVRSCRLLWALGKLVEAGLLPEAAMRQHGQACMGAAVEVVSAELRAQGQREEGAAGQQGQEAGAAGAEAAALGGGSSARSDLPGRSLVMGMWGLAKLQASGYTWQQLQQQPQAPAGAQEQPRGGEDPHSPAGGADSPSAAPAPGPGPGPSPVAVQRSMRRADAALWGLLAQHAAQSVDGLTTRELVNALWAMGTARHVHCGPWVTRTLLDALAARLADPRDCNAQDTANAVWALARLGVDREEGVLRVAEAAVLRVLPQLRHEHVASLLWSFSVMGYVPRPAAPVLGSDGAGPAAMAGASRGRQLYGALAQRAQQLDLVERADVAVVAQVVWALVRERLAGAGLLHAAARRLEACAGQLNLHESAMVAGAYADARCFDRPLFEALLRQAGAQLGRRSAWAGGREGRDVSLALLLRGLAWARCYDEGVYRRLVSSLSSHLPTIQPQTLSLALWALARVQHRPAPFLSQAALVATALVRQLRGGELSTVALSLASLGVRSPEFFDAAARALTEKHRPGAAGGGGGGQQGAAEGQQGGGGEQREPAAGGSAQPLVPGWGAGLREAGEDEDEVDEDEDEEDEAYDMDELAAEYDELGQAARGAGGAPAGTTGDRGAEAAQRRRVRKRGGQLRCLARAQRASRRPVWLYVDRLNPLELANTLAAFARAGHIDELLFQRIEVRTLRLLRASGQLRRAAVAAELGPTGPGASSTSAYIPTTTGLVDGARAGLRPGAGQRLRQGDPVHDLDLSAGVLVKLLWAFVAVGNDGPILRELAERVVQVLYRLEPRDIAALAWALATSRLPGGEELVGRAVHAATQHAQAFRASELATTAWAAASLGRPCGALLATCGRIVADVHARRAAAQQPGPAQAPGAPEGHGGESGGLVAAVSGQPLVAAISAGAGTGGAAGGGLGGVEGRSGLGPPQLSLQTLSDVVWAHTQLRCYSPPLLQQAAALASEQLALHELSVAGGGAVGGSSEHAFGAAAADPAGGTSPHAERPVGHQQDGQQGGQQDRQRGGQRQQRQRQREGAEEEADVGVGPLALSEALDLQHVVSLLEAYATWGEYDDGLYRCLAAVLLRNLHELTSDQVVVCTWACAMVLRLLPPAAGPAADRPPTSCGTAAAAAAAAASGGEQPRVGARPEQQHPVVQLLHGLSGLLGGMPPDSLLSQELLLLAQAHAASSVWAAAQEGRGPAAATPAAAAAAAGADAPAVSRGAGGARKRAAASARAAAAAAGGPLALRPALVSKVVGLWKATPALSMRRPVVELCAALAERGFERVELDARGAGGLVPVDVAAVLPAGREDGGGGGYRRGWGRAEAAAAWGSVSARGGQSSYRWSGPGVGEMGLEAAQLAPRSAGWAGGGEAGVSGGGGDEGNGEERYAFLLAPPSQHAEGRPEVLRAPLLARIHALRAEGWRVVVVPLPVGDGEVDKGAGGGQARAGGGGARRAGWEASRLPAEEVREHVRAVLASALDE